MIELTCSDGCATPVHAPKYLNPLWASRRNNARSWAQNEFDRARLGDSRRTSRLVAIATHLALHPAALVTQVFATDRKAMNAAYDFLENEAIVPSQLFEAHFAATAARCARYRFAFVAIDGSSLHFDDADGQRGMGHIGTNRAGAKGLKTMTALAISPDGIVQGAVGVSLWVRQQTQTKPRHSRSVEEKETRFWHQTIDQARNSLERHGGACLLWLQMDREADSWSLILKALELDAEGGCWGSGKNKVAFCIV